MAALATMASEVDLTAVGTALVAIAGLMIVPGAIKWGARKIISFFG